MWAQQEEANKMEIEKNWLIVFTISGVNSNKFQSISLSICSFAIQRLIGLLLCQLWNIFKFSKSNKRKAWLQVHLPKDYKIKPLNS